MIVDFADVARLHKGFRLIQRCIRHAIDPQTYSILFATVYIVDYNNKPCLLVHHRMEASMRNETHDVVVCFDDENIVACSCSCKVGGWKDHRIICVHVLPVIYQITLLLFDGMAEHVIVELSNHWRSITGTAREVSENDLAEIKNNILTIISASHLNLPEYNDNTTIEELLHSFNVGTEKAKRVIVPPRNPTILGPLRLQDFSSIYKRAENIINGVNVRYDNENNNFENNDTNDGHEDDSRNDESSIHHCNITPINTTTYQHIAKHIASLINIFASTNNTNTFIRG
jgi:hypothetical protein